MKKYFILGALFSTLILLGVGPLWAASKFVPGIDDLPLMQGLALKSETPVVFDTPGGRIVEVFASGKVPRLKIQAFYGETLLQLGWKPHAANSFQRDGEVLVIEIAEDGKGAQVVRFSLVPEGQQKGAN